MVMLWYTTEPRHYVWTPTNVIETINWQSNFFIFIPTQAMNAGCNVSQHRSFQTISRIWKINCQNCYVSSLHCSNSTARFFFSCSCSDEYPCWLSIKHSPGNQEIPGFIWNLYFIWGMFIPFQGVTTGAAFLRLRICCWICCLFLLCVLNLYLWSQIFILLVYWFVFFFFFFFFLIKTHNWVWSWFIVVM